ncbi:tetratricopeptide repeat protein [Viridibacterium curvum]|uniref:Tetratricopeptide repeat protein n=1 Tax=Viridibacterium curvum TaxID=1101404 RepID=A0ABP9Q8R8_9RHOO
MKKSGKHKNAGQRPDPLAPLLAQALGAHQQGQLAQAEQIYTHILQQQATHFDALHFCGVLHMQSNRAESGVALIERALQQRESADALTNLANGLLRLKRHADALQRLDRALALEPRQPAAHTNRGVALAALDRHEEAAAAYRKALQYQPVFPEALNNLGNALRALERYDEAIAALDQALQQRPGYAEALNNRGLALAARKDYSAALDSYAQALASRPRYAEALNNRGNVFKDLLRFDEAQQSYDAALAIDPNYAEARYNRGNNLGAQNRHIEALQDYALALQLQPAHADANWNTALSQLLLGDFTAGFQHYEWRWRLKHAEARRHFDCPEWTGKQALTDRHIIVWAEQGLGDTLQFCRLLQGLVERGARVTFEVQPALKRLLSRLPQITVFARGDTAPAADFHCPLLSLPARLALTPDALPFATRYLAATECERADWLPRLPAAPLRIGLCCSGNPRLANDHNRSVALARFGALAGEGRQLILMQKDLRASDEAVLNDLSILDLRKDLHDFCDTAAALSHCDLLISVDTSVAHLAGAIGIPTWILLPFAPDWRWQLQRNDSPWYPGARLFRQPAPGAWDAVFAQVSAALADLPHHA